MKTTVTIVAAATLAGCAGITEYTGISEVDQACILLAGMNTGVQPIPFQQKAQSIMAQGYTCVMTPDGQVQAAPLGAVPADSLPVAGMPAPPSDG